LRAKVNYISCNIKYCILFISHMEMSKFFCKIEKNKVYFSK
jgi:hypothetical protein